MTPSDVAHYFVYEYTFIDDHRFIFPPKRVLGTDIGPSSEDWPAVEAALERKFKAKGWEGDGEPGAIWLPPFMFKDSDSYGILVWHVKQSNNGVSFIASPVPLNSPDLR